MLRNRMYNMYRYSCYNMYPSHHWASHYVLFLYIYNIYILYEQHTWRHILMLEYYFIVFVCDLSNVSSLFIHMHFNIIYLYIMLETFFKMQQYIVSGKLETVRTTFNLISRYVHIGTNDNSMVERLINDYLLNKLCILNNYIFLSDDLLVYYIEPTLLRPILSFLLRSILFIRIMSLTYDSESFFLQIFVSHHVCNNNTVFE